MDSPEYGYDRLSRSHFRRDVKWMLASALSCALSTGCIILTSIGMPGHAYQGAVQIPIILVLCISVIALASTSAKVIWALRGSNRK